MKSNLSISVVDSRPSTTCSECGGRGMEKSALLLLSDGTRIRLCTSCLARLCREANSALIAVTRPVRKE